MPRLPEETEPIFVALRKGSHLRRDEHGQVVRLDGKGIEGVTIARGQRATPPIPPLTSHDLRATFILLALEGKSPLQTVQFDEGESRLLLSRGSWLSSGSRI